MDSFSRADYRVQQSLLRLHTPEFAPLLNFTRALLEQTKMALIRADEVQVGRLQGRALVLQDLVDAVDAANTGTLA